MTKEGWSDLSQIAQHEAFGDMMHAMTAVDYERERRLASKDKRGGRAFGVMWVTKVDITNVAKKMVDLDYLEQLDRQRWGGGISHQWAARKWLHHMVSYQSVCLPLKWAPALRGKG
jgi:hypothetical protein